MMKKLTHLAIVALATLPLVAFAGGMSCKAKYNQDEAQMAEAKHWQTLSSKGEKIQVAYYQGNYPKTHKNSILVSVKKER